MQALNVECYGFPVKCGWEGRTFDGLMELRCPGSVQTSSTLGGAACAFLKILPNVLDRHDFSPLSGCRIPPSSDWLCCCTCALRRLLCASPNQCLILSGLDGMRKERALGPGVFCGFAYISTPAAKGMVLRALQSRMASLAIYAVLFCNCSLL